MRNCLLPAARCQAILQRYRQLKACASTHVSCSGFSPHRARFLAPSEAATGALASLLAQQRRPGDCLCLNGEVGSGKSAFSRAYIRAVEEDDQMPVPSPTYLLQNVYEYDDGPWVYHYDLYRLQDAADLQRLDLRESLKTGVNLVEWPARLAEMTPEERLDVEIQLANPAVEKAAMELGHVPADALKEGDEDGGAYEDHRWRCITLSPHGRHWEGVVQEIVERLCSQSIGEGTNVATGGLRHVSGALEEAVSKLG